MITDSRAFDYASLCFDIASLKTFEAFIALLAEGATHQCTTSNHNIWHRLTCSSFGLRPHFVHTMSTLCQQMIPLGGSYNCTLGCNYFVQSYMYPARIDHIWEADGLKRRVVWESSVLKLVSTTSTSCQQDPLLPSCQENSLLPSCQQDP